MESLLFLVEKHDGSIKARHCANGSVQCNWISSEDTASPTVSTELVMLTAVINAKENRDVAVTDVPNAFIQTPIEECDDDGKKMIMKIRGVLVEILCNMDKTYEEYVSIEQEKRYCTCRFSAQYMVSSYLHCCFTRNFVKALRSKDSRLIPMIPALQTSWCMVNGSSSCGMWTMSSQVTWITR